jgi:hypothetical protein
MQMFRKFLQLKKTNGARLALIVTKFSQTSVFTRKTGLDFLLKTQTKKSILWGGVSHSKFLLS